MGRYAYYNRLSNRQQRTYRLSDEVGAIALDAPEDFTAAVDWLAAALEAEKRRDVQRAARHLCNRVTDALNVEPTACDVLAARPKDRDGSELHGLYTRDEYGDALIEVWMRTAAHGRVVKFRTFLRTLCHELCHHLDFELLDLEDTFHTEGFFLRESSLFKQLMLEVES